MGESKDEKTRNQRLKEIRREIGLLLDEANLLIDDRPTEERQPFEAMMDLLEAMDGKEALAKSSDPSAD